MERSRSLVPSLPGQLRQRFSSPLRSLTQMEEDIQIWFDEANVLPSGMYDGVDFVPQCDLKEANKEYVAIFDVPSVNGTLVVILKLPAGQVDNPF